MCLRNQLTQVAAACMLFALLQVWPAAQDNASTAQAPQVDRAQIENRIRLIEENAALDPEAKSAALDTLRKSLEQLGLFESWQAKTAEMSKAMEEAPANIEALQKELGRPIDSNLKGRKIADIGLEELIQINTQLEQSLASQRDELSQLENEGSQRAERRRLLPELQNAAFLRLQEARAALDAAIPADKPDLAEAQQSLNRARVQAIEAEINSYNIESQGFETRNRLRNLRIDAAARQIGQLEKDIKEVQTAIAAKRREQAAQVAKEARKALLEAANAPPQIRDLAEQLAAEISGFADARLAPDGILNKIEQTNSAIKTIEAETAELAQEFTKSKNRAEVAERSNVVGTMLRTQKTKLPSAYEYRRRLSQYENELTTVQLEIIEIEEERRGLNDIEGKISGILAESAPLANDEQRKALAKLLRELYESKRAAHETRLNDLDLYSERLVEIQSEIQQLLSITGEFRNFINERILWARSGFMIHPSDWRNVVDTLRWIFSPANTLAAGAVLSSDVQENNLLHGFALMVCLLLVVTRIRLRTLLEHAAEFAGKSTCVSMTPTLKAILASTLFAAAPPLLAAFLGWRLAAPLDADEYTRALGAALMGTAAIWWAISTLRVILAPNGLGPAHLGWAEQPCKNIAQLLLLAQPFVLVGAFLLILVQSQQSIDRQETAGRLLYVLFMPGVAYLLARLLRQRGGPLLDVIDMRRGKGHLASRRYWQILAQTIAGALILLALAGYYYTALQLTYLLAQTIAAIFLVLLSAEFILRWAMLSRRKIAMAQRKKKSSDGAADQQKADEKAALAAADRQTSRMVWISFLFVSLAIAGYIWNDMFPAIRFLDEIKLSRYTAEITQEVPDPANDGAMIMESRLIQQEVTLRHLVIALGCALITLLAMRNLPGFLELAVLQNTRLGTGERYAIRTLVSYFILFSGIFFTFNYIGLQWSQLQWLVAALGVGLGFGLQEIFANFVSGIVILFERPIRVGDTVTVGDISGTVSKIRIRATHITAFNRQELIVPNKEFVTNRLINWNLTDQVLRVEIDIGIAYGSDTEKARAILMELARNHPIVLKDPEPRVAFVGFGDSTLNFKLYVFSPSVEFMLDIRDELNTAIEKAFRENGIDFAYPQRDVHIRSVEPSILAKLEKEPDTD